MGKEDFTISDATIEEMQRVSEGNRERAEQESADREAFATARGLVGRFLGLRFEAQGRRYEIVLRDADDTWRDLEE
jgi:hypothetical protein